MAAWRERVKSAGNDMSRGKPSASKHSVGVCLPGSSDIAFDDGFRSTNQHRVFSRAYVQMKTTEDLTQFAQAYDGHVFRGKDGEQYQDPSVMSVVSLSR
jgi:hypothetical protein